MVLGCRKKLETALYMFGQEEKEEGEGFALRKNARSGLECREAEGGIRHNGATSNG